MSNSWFRFKKFRVGQERCAMKVGTDGVLLGAWCDTAGARTILDIGTGTGLIALMCAQRSNAKVHGIEIDENAASQARENFQTSPWKDRLTLYHDSFQHFCQNNTCKYDLLVANPPFFRNSLKPEGTARSMARHDDQLTYEALLHYAPSLLFPSGKLAIILPYAEINRFTDMAFTSGLYLIRQLSVRPHAGKPFSRCLAEYSLDRQATLITGELEIKKQNAPEYTEAFISLTRNFYLAY